MKTKIAAIFCLALSYASTAFADDTKGIYVGLKAGTLNIDLASTGLDADNANTFSLIGGYAFGNGLSAELEFIPTTEADIMANGFKVGQLEIDTIGFYAAYRAALNNSPVFFKVKGGILSEQVDIKGNKGSISETDSGLSFGLGMGYKLNNQVSLELEYTLIEQDVDFISGGLNVKF